MVDIVHLDRIDLMDEYFKVVPASKNVNNPTIYRASESLTRGTLYSPRYVSLGLYNKDVKDSATIGRSKIQTKLEMAKVFKDTVKKSWKEICDLVVKDPEDMKRMYDDCSMHETESVRNLLTLDAIFVTCVLHTLWDVHNCDRHSVLRRFQGIGRVVQDRGLDQGSGIILDILGIFENQIPFALIIRVVEMMYPNPTMNGSTSSAENRDLTSGYLTDAGSVNSVESLHSKSDGERAGVVVTGITEVACGLMRYHLPGRIDQHISSPLGSTEGCSHLLECVYRGALQHIKPWLWPELGDNTRPIATATQLKKAGIKIVRGSENISDVRFKKGFLTATLTLPQLRITPWTESVLRNLVAFESRVLKKGDLMCYLSFMDQLIDTEEDVLLLKQSKLSVIEFSHLSSDAEVAELFNSLLQNSIAVPVSKKWANLRKNIHFFYNNDKRQLWIEFVQINFGRPWITASVLAAASLLVMTFLQTFYTLKCH